MPKIRLNKAVKELNISISRAVEYLQSKGVDVESNPNALLESEAFSALEAEFRKDGEQKKASHEVVISKVPDEKLEIEEVKPEVIRAKAAPQTGAKILGKIDLGEEKPKEVEEAPKPEPVKEPAQPVVEKTEEPQEQEFKVLGKIDLSQIRSDRPKHSDKKDKKPEAPKKEEPKVQAEAPKAEVKPVEKKVEEVKPAQPETPQEPQKIETVYQKLDGPKILKEKVDLSQFQQKPKKESGDNSFKKKRKRITKEGGNQGQNNNNNNNQGQNNNQGRNNNNNNN